MTLDHPTLGLGSQLIQRFALMREEEWARALPGNIPLYLLKESGGVQRRQVERSRHKRYRLTVTVTLPPRSGDYCGSWNRRVRGLGKNHNMKVRSEIILLDPSLGRGCRRKNRRLRDGGRLRTRTWVQETRMARP
ncbi:unnamed protein product [Nezara viridula]|uniref:Uncharacterized protein n=1 Tax=Nezara viridula TaxID=85310 RepID=A0A9P0EAA7_NEZVI|nr:unnamed protein product [Nezara viridula]